MLVIYTAWAAIHLLLIRLSIRDRTAAMPALALPADIAWDAYRLSSGQTPFPQYTLIDAAWPVFALANVWFVSRHARRDLCLGLPERFFWPLLAGASAAFYALIAAFCAGTPEGPARLYTMFGAGVSVIWSASFLVMVRSRPTLAGQSLTVWALRFFGASGMTLYLGARTGAPHLLLAGGAALALDALYLRDYLRLSAKGR